MSKTTNKFAPEVRDRAVRMVLDHGGEQAVRRDEAMAQRTRIASPYLSVLDDAEAEMASRTKAIGAANRRSPEDKEAFWTEASERPWERSADPIPGSGAKARLRGWSSRTTILRCFCVSIDIASSGPTISIGCSRIEAAIGCPVV